MPKEWKRRSTTCPSDAPQGRSGPHRLPSRPAAALMHIGRGWQMDARAEGRIMVERDGTVLVLSLAHPPVNALRLALRRELWALLDMAAEDPAILSVVVRSALGTFSAGADLGEFDTPQQAPSLPDLCLKIEGMEKPVIVAIAGVALGGGLELALAAHGRVASDSASLGLPEVTLGLLPGAGGTQRLPRLIGAEQALRMMLSGRPVPAPEALATGLLDAVVAGDPTGRARELARELAGRTPPRSCDRRDGMRDGRAYLAAVDAARKGLPRSRLPAPARIVDCVASAQLLPFAQGLRFERAAFAELLATPESAGLRHVFRAERPVLRLPAALQAETALPAERVTVWGAEERGIGLAERCLAAGLRVTLADTGREPLVAALQAIAARQEQAVAAGRLSPAARDADWARLSPLVAPDRLAETDAVLLARGDPPTMPQSLLRLAFGVTAAAPAVAVALVDGPRPLAEIGWTAGDAAAPAARAVALARQLRWRPVVTGRGGPASLRLARALADAVAVLEAQGRTRADIAAALGAHGIAGDGFGAGEEGRGADIAARCIGALANEGAQMVAEGVLAHPSDVDAVAVMAGIMARFTGGPMYQADLRGLLVLRRDLNRWAVDAPDLWTPAPLIEACLSRGIGLTDLPRC